MASRKQNQAAAADKKGLTTYKAAMEKTKTLSTILPGNRFDFDVFIVVSGSFGTLPTCFTNHGL